MNTDTPAVVPDASPAAQQGPRLEVDIYQIAGDEMFAATRQDGTGWTWSWADWRRDWMDNTANKFAYRCLPLTIANQTGWHVHNPVGFTAYWNGRNDPGHVQCLFDTDAKGWGGWINNQFGNGILTWNTPFLFRTRPAQSRLLVIGPANHFKHGAAPLTAVVESDWMNMSFTMNWKLTSPGLPVRFDAGEPLFQVIPMAGNVCGDLESAAVTYQKLQDAPDVHAAYLKWQQGRTEFQRRKAIGEINPDAWQKDYFQGKDMLGRPVTSGHTTRVTPPRIEYKSTPPGK